MSRTAAPSSEVALVQPHGVTVRLNVIDSRSWFHVADSAGKTLFEGILVKGQTKDFSDPKQIRLIVGAPKAVDLVVNGKDIGSLPETGGNVGHVVFTPAPSSNAASILVSTSVRSPSCITSDRMLLAASS